MHVYMHVNYVTYVVHTRISPHMDIRTDTYPQTHIRTHAYPNIRTYAHALIWILGNDYGPGVI